jgi:hypothetical protein
MNVLQDRNNTRKIWEGVTAQYNETDFPITDPSSPIYWNGRGEIPPKAGPAPKKEMRDIRDAAFVAMVIKESDPGLSGQLSAIVRSVLLKQAKVANLDVTNSSPGQTTFWPRYGSNAWTRNISDLGPGFVMSSFLQSMLFAYDYLKEDFTASERKELDTWFYNQAEYWGHTVDVSHDYYFVNRNSGNWSLTKAGEEMEQGRHPGIRTKTRFYAPDKPGGGGLRRDGNGNVIRVLPVGREDIPSNYIDSPNEVSGFSVRYNNRFGNLSKFVALVGIMQDKENLKKSAKLYWKETMMFAVYPDGLPGEMERWVAREPQAGWGYATFVADQLLTVADAFARSGDFELYEYSTRHGVYGTECKSGEPAKTLKRVIEGMLKLLDGTYTYYATSTAGGVGDIENRIWDRLKSGAGHRGGYWVNDNWFSQANVYYKDNYIKNGYLRKNPGMNKYISNPEHRGPHSPYEGPWGEFPSKIFMFGEMEGKVWPYPIPLQKNIAK